MCMYHTKCGRFLKIVSKGFVVPLTCNYKQLIKNSVALLYLPRKSHTQMLFLDFLRRLAFPTGTTSKRTCKETSYLFNDCSFSCVHGSREHHDYTSR